MIDLNELYKQTQEESQNLSSSGGGKKNTLSCNRTTTVYFKLTPYVNEKGDTKLFKQFGRYNFKNAEGRSFYAGTAPHTIGLPDPIKDKRDQHFANGEKSIGAKLYPLQRALYSVFVVSDSESPENNGKFLVLDTGYKEKSQYGKGSPFRNFIEESIADEDDPKNPNDIWSIGEEDLRIRMDITKNANSAPDISYRWVSGKDGNPFSKSGDLISFFKAKAFDLDFEVPAPKSDEELIGLYNKHILGVSVESSVDVGSIPSTPTQAQPVEVEDDIPMDFPQIEKKEAPSSAKEEAGDIDINALLNDIPDLD